MTPRTTAPAGVNRLGVKPSVRCAAWVVALVCAAATAQAAAQPDAPADAPAGAQADAAAPAAAPSPAQGTARGEPAVQQRVLEDDHIVIEELRVRGQPVRISVRGKTPGARGYEVNVGAGGRDASQESGRAGQSAWRLLSF